MNRSLRRRPLSVRIKIGMIRSEIIKRVSARKRPWDIIVIGGGATGVGCALDAASRGFDVLLLEQHDFGKGTSSRSTKLVHGGVRYLAQGNISLVREALRERGILFRNAPHAVHKQAFVIPCYSRWQKIFYSMGLKFYDLLSGKHSIGRSRILSRSETLDRLPTIIPEGLAGGVLYFDGQFDDARLLIDMVITAGERGAAVLNYTKVTSFEKDAEHRITGVKFQDVETGERFCAQGKAVINAAGVFTDTVRTLADAEADSVVTYSQGIHLVLRPQFMPSDSAVMIPKTSDGRVLFCIPWHEHLLIGTTDTPVDMPSLEPHALESEIDFVLQTVGAYLTTKPSRKDILSVFAGIRPLVRSDRTAKTSSISRSHYLLVEETGLITITGGKWTTYRRMAEETINKAIELGGLERNKSATQYLAIAGPATSRGGDRLHPDLPYADTDVTQAVRDELARTLEDVLARRTRALFLNSGAAIAIAQQTAEIMAKELGKDAGWIKQQVNDFIEVAENYSSVDPRTSGMQKL